VFTPACIHDAKVGWPPNQTSPQPLSLSAKLEVAAKEAPHGDLQKFLDRGDHGVHETKPPFVNHESYKGKTTYLRRKLYCVFTTPDFIKSGLVPLDSPGS
jgi:hypothetical protein